MTREEAIDVLKSYLMFDKSSQQVAKALDMAIEALKEQPTIPMFAESAEAYKAWTGEEMGKDIKAKQKELCAVADGIVGHETIQKQVEKAKKKFSRPHGEWKDKEVFNETDDDHIVDEWQSARCSVCGKYHTTPYMYYFDNFNFCPNCGADMRGEEE